MNIFRFSGDLLHLGSILLLIYKLLSTKNCSGISLRMQEVYLIVFLTRYIDLLYNFISLYNTIMKLTFIFTTAMIIYMMRFMHPINQSYDRKSDYFNYVLYLVAPCCVIGLLSGRSFYPSEILWRFSIWLESVAIIPQLRLLQKCFVVENLTSHYVVTMGAYRLCYILNWVYRYHTENFINYVGWTAGLIQVGLYLDFFYYYFKARISGSKLILPYATRV